jgi:hypothetical protein
VAQAKRSPILGYNHNIKYRGLVFHVQTEDSGLLNPHLFTHLFYEGVIVSTRKLVYDAGSNEDAIKALMQAQHKAVMKDLKRGLFDDKIDKNLAGTPDLEPRVDPAAAAARRSERAKTEASPPPEEVIAASMNAGLETASGTGLEIITEELSEPIELPIKQRVKSEDRTRPIELPVSRAQTPPPVQQEAPVKARTSTAQRGSPSRGGGTPARGSRTVGAAPPPVDISEEEISSRLRAPRDTAVEVPDDSDGVPSRHGDSIPPGATVPVRNDRAAAHNAAALPPSKPRPVAPAVARTDSENERGGTYSVSRKSGDAPIREKTGRIAAIGSQPQAPVARPGVPSRSPTGERQGGSGPNRVPQNVQREPTPGTAIPRTGTPPNSPGRPTPQNIRPSVTAPIQNRASTPANPQPNSGVVMTRPAVVVGAPPKQAQPPRVRKAREDEGRGFGQGLISEKSLDEVILAYLSEDADDK